MSCIVVTGAAGFIGSHVTQALVAAGWQVRGIDSFTNTYDPQQKRRNLSGVPDSRFELVEADLASDDVGALLEGADAVAHLAAEPGVGASWGTTFASYLERNALATQRVLEAAVSTRIGRVVYASSSSVYGNGITTPLTEAAALRPASPYGASKLLGELLLSAYVEQRGLPGVSLRYFSVYGPRQRPDMAAHRFIEALLDGRPLALYGDGSQLRDFTYIDDVVAATVAALTGDIRPGTILNIAAGIPVSIQRLIDLLGELMACDRVAVDRRPQRYGDVVRTEGDGAAAARMLGWRARTDLRTGLARQIAWHRCRRAGEYDVARPQSAMAGASPA
jgi:UDP-glucuronate 4-epimerase